VIRSTHSGHSAGSAEEAREPSAPSPGDQGNESASGALSAQATARRKKVSSTAHVPAQPTRTGTFDLEEREPKYRELLHKSRAAIPKVPVLSTGMADRLAERDAIERHDRRRKRLIVSGVLAVLVGVVWLFGFSSVFALNLNQVQISGAQLYVSEQEILDAIAGHEGTPLVRVDLGRINSQVAELKNVKSVTQTRRWPDGVTITVHERTPVAAVPEEEGFTLLDIDAVNVTHVDEAPAGLPVIRIPMTGENQRTLATALEILDQIPDTLLAEIASITASTQDNIEFTLRDKVKVQWGNSQDTELKLEVLDRLRPIAAEEKKKTIDLSAPTFPIIR
jgi:cell division protein FtsQ